jgi:serine/threonine protein kinase
MQPGDQVGSYLLLDETAQGEEATIYRALKDGDYYALKVSDDGKEGHVAKEASILSMLLDEPDPRLVPYLPEFHETFVTDGGKWVNAFTHLDGFYSLKQVLTRYPGGIDPRDMAWMFRRLLVVLGFAYEQQFVHGAIVPDHVMIHPEMHGLVLVDWCYSTMEEMPQTLWSQEYLDWYPKTVLGHEAYHQMDLAMAARTMLYVMGGDPKYGSIPDGIPKEYRAFFNAMLMPTMAAHPWQIKEHFDDLLERLYGPRRFRPFSMA